MSFDSLTRSWRPYLLLALLCCAFYLPGLTRLPPTDRDEARFAQATKQMVESGNYVDIRFQSAVRYKKPVPVDTEITGRARVREQKRRLLTTAAWIEIAGEVYAEADAKVFRLDKGKQS